MTRNENYFSVIGIEYGGATKISTICLLGTFSTIYNAQNFIKNKSYPAIYTLVDIVETKIDAKYDPTIDNIIHI
jgi:hypothetical protein